MPKNVKVRMYSRNGKNIPSKSQGKISIKSMFDLFITEKSVEGLSERTINDNNIHFGYQMEFIGEDISNTQFTKHLFKNYIAFMLHGKG